MTRGPTEMELRVAKAIHEDGIYAGRPKPWDELDETSRYSYILKAQAAIRAMQEPTQEAFNAACGDLIKSGSPDRDYLKFLRFYKAMIDAESPEET